MKRVEKTVFISYRRTNVFMALAIYQDLTSHGYDVFFDYQSIGSGDFEQAILGNIAARAHFIIILTPSALEQCAEPGDWLRREIEYAVKMKRNIIPLMFDNFDFNSPAIGRHLSGSLAVLRRYQALNVPVEFFFQAMERLRSDQFLNKPLDAVFHPPTPEVIEAATTAQRKANAAPEVTTEDLVASDWLEEAISATDLNEQIRCYSMAISLNSDYDEAYIGRATARYFNGDIEGALADFSEALAINPYHFGIYNNRGNLYADLGDLEKAIADYSEAIDLNPRYTVAYYNRGNVLVDRGDLSAAIADYSQALRLDPQYTEAYYNRGRARADAGDIDGAIADYSEVLRLHPQNVNAYNNRGVERMNKGDLDGAIADFDEAIRLDPQLDMVRRNREIALQKVSKRDTA